LLDILDFSGDIACANTHLTMSSKHAAVRYGAIIMFLAVFFIAVSPSGEASERFSSGSIVSNDKELIIQVQGLSVKNTAAVRKAIEDNSGVTFRGICYQNSVLMYVIDRDLQPDNSFVDDVMKAYNLTYVVKEGTIVQVMAACSDPETVPSTQTE
jgi:hypothetical protein